MPTIPWVADEKRYMSNELILVVDDETTIRKNVTAALRLGEYRSVEASDGVQALEVMELTLPDLVILDINMPNLDGFQVCQRIREWSQVPIIMVSARIDEQDKVKALRLGADDYLVKPYGIDELLARVEAVLRRTKAAELPQPAPTLITGDLQVNFAQRLVTVGGREVQLTATEYNLLSHLALNRGKVLTHRMLLHEVWGPEYGDEREYVRVFVNRLRNKLGDDPSKPRYIRTESGVGYRFLAPPES